MRKTFKYRLHPTKSQKTMLKQTLDCCRWLYNKTLETRKTSWETDKKGVSRYETVKMIPKWKAKKPELKQAYSQVLQEVCIRVDLAFRAFFRRVKQGKEKPGYPKFQSWKFYDSFTYPQAGFNLLDDGKLRLSKIGDVRVNLHRPLEGQCKTLTIIKDKLDNWYACFSCIVEFKPLPVSGEVIGIDVGLSTFATLSNGEKIANPRFFKQEEKALLKMRSKRDKAKKGSYKRKKLIRATQHIEERIKNRRIDFAHKIAKQLVNEYQVIVFEDLDIEEMKDGNYRSMNKSIADVAWGRFIELTEAKAKEASRRVIKVNPRGTTQECSGCGKIVPKDLSVRIHNCSYCGLVLDRDVNAAKNVLARGLMSIG